MEWFGKGFPAGYRGGAGGKGFRTVLSGSSRAGAMSSETAASPWPGPEGSGLHTQASWLLRSVVILRNPLPSRTPSFLPSTSLSPATSIFSPFLPPPLPPPRQETFCSEAPRHLSASAASLRTGAAEPTAQAGRPRLPAGSADSWVSFRSPTPGQTREGGMGTPPPTCRAPQRLSPPTLSDSVSSIGLAGGSRRPRLLRRVGTRWRGRGTGLPTRRGCPQAPWQRAPSTMGGPPSLSHPHTWQLRMLGSGQ